MFVSVFGEMSVDRKIIAGDPAIEVVDWATPRGINLVESPRLKVIHQNIGNTTNDGNSIFQKRLRSLVEENSVWGLTVSVIDSHVKVISKGYQETLAFRPEEIEQFCVLILRHGRVEMEFIMLTEGGKEESIFTYPVKKDYIELHAPNTLDFYTRTIEWMQKN